jgi:hypothetical protein
MPSLQEVRRAIGSALSPVARYLSGALALIALAVSVWAVASDSHRDAALAVAVVVVAAAAVLLLVRNEQARRLVLHSQPFHATVGLVGVAVVLAARYGSLNDSEWDDFWSDNGDWILAAALIALAAGAVAAGIAVVRNGQAKSTAVGVLCALLLLLVVGGPVALILKVAHPEIHASVCDPPAAATPRPDEPSPATKSSRASVQQATSTLTIALRAVVGPGEPTPRQAQALKSARALVDALHPASLQALARAQAAANQSGPATPEQESALAAAKTRADKLKPIDTTLPDDVVTTFSLGRDVNAGPRSVTFALSRVYKSPSRVLTAEAGPFSRTSDGKPISSNAIDVWAYVNPDGVTATAAFCVHPEARENAPSGTFAGQLTVSDPRLESIVIPINFSMSYPRADKVAGVGLLGCFLTSLYVFLLRQKEIAETEQEKRRLRGVGERLNIDESAVLRPDFGFWRLYWLFVTTTHGLVTIAAGLIAAAAAYSAQYLTADAWDNTLPVWITFLGAIASAFITGGTAGKLAQMTLGRTPERAPGSGVNAAKKTAAKKTAAKKAAAKKTAAKKTAAKKTT